MKEVKANQFMVHAETIPTIESLENNSITLAGGWEARYYQMTSATGIKVFKSIFTAGCLRDFEPEEVKHFFGTPAELKNSPLWRRIQEVFFIMKYFQMKRRGPKVFQMLIVQDGNFFLPAIEMEHVEVDSAYNSPRRRGYWRFITMLAKAWGDIDHEGTNNVVYDVKAKRFKVLDFGTFDPNRYEERVGEAKSEKFRSLKKQIFKPEAALHSETKMQ
jgi:hypothetical protein